MRKIVEEYSPGSLSIVRLDFDWCLLGHSFAISYLLHKAVARIKWINIYKVPGAELGKPQSPADVRTSAQGERLLTSR